MSSRAGRSEPAAAAEPESGSGGRRRYLLFVAGYALAAMFFLWTRGPLLREGLWRDDGISVAIARVPTAREFMHRLSFLDSQPPLFPGSLALWGNALGWGETSLKVLAFAWGAAAVGAIAALAAVLFGPGAGILALLFASTHPLLRTMPSDLRPYAGSIVFTCLTLIAVFGFRHPPAAGRRALLASAFPLLLYSQYTGTLVGVVVGGCALAGCMRAGKRRFWLPVLYGAVFAGVLFLPWLPMFRTHSRIGLPWDPSLTFGERAARLPARLKAVVPWMSAEWSVAAAIGCQMLLFVAIARWRGIAKDRRWAMPSMVVALCAATVFVAMSFFADPARYLVLPAALACVLLAGAITRLPAMLDHRLLQALAVAGAGLIVAGSFLRASGSLSEIINRRLVLPKSGARALCSELTPSGRDLVLAVPDFSATSLRYYCGNQARIRGYPQWDEPEIPRWDRYRELWREPVENLITRLDGLLARGEIDRIWLVILQDPGALRSIPVIRARLLEVQRSLPRCYAAARPRTFPGRLEGFVVTELRPQPSAGAASIISTR